MLALALFNGSDHTWASLATVWASRLTVVERAKMVFALTATFEDDERELITEALEAALPTTGGFPMAPLGDPKTMAQEWVKVANREEITAFLAFGYLSLKPKDRRDFREFVEGKP